MNSFFENWRIDKTVEGVCLLLFRVEASDAPSFASDIGGDVLPTGAVAGFPMPTLRYCVGNSTNTDIEQITKTNLPMCETAEPLLPIILRWKTVAETKLCRLEIEDEAGREIFPPSFCPPPNNTDCRRSSANSSLQND